MIETAWLWIRHQPKSALTRWFVERTAGQSTRVRKILIVAVARKLAIALWRYVEHGMVSGAGRSGSCRKVLMACHATRLGRRGSPD
jgi:transposase